MTDTPPGDQATLFPKSAGERLRDAREAQGLSLAEIASRTRIPLRQLDAIEAGEYAQLPSVTYAVGFARAYARVVGLDEVEIAREVRGHNDQYVRRVDYEMYEVADPSRVPSRGLAWAGVAVAVLLLVAVGIWYALSLRGDSAPSAAAAGAPEAVPTLVAAPKPAVPATGQVSLTATDQVWLRVYDASGKTLYERTMAPGDRYDVPANANGPLLNVGRPDKLQVTVNGSAIPPLGDGSRAIKDVPLTAAGLSARAGGAAPATTPATAAPRVSAAAPDASSSLNIASPAGQPSAAATGAP